MNEESDDAAGDDEYMDDPSATKLEGKAQDHRSDGSATQQNARKYMEGQGLNPPRELVWTDPSLGTKIWTRMADGTPGGGGGVGHMPGP